MLTLEVISFKNAELLIIGGSQCVEALLFKSPSKFVRRFVLLRIKLVSVLQYYPSSKTLLVSQSRFGVFLFKVDTSPILAISLLFAGLLNESDFSHFNSIFLIEEVPKEQLILCIPSIEPDSETLSNVDYYILCRERKAITQIFYFQSEHRADITCLMGRFGDYEIVLGDISGCISKHRIIPGNRYTCSAVIDPVLCLDRKVYMLQMGLEGKFLLVGNDQGKVKVVQYSTLNLVWSISVSPQFINVFYVQSLDNSNSNQSKAFISPLTKDSDNGVNPKAVTNQMINKIQKHFRSN